MSYLPPICSLKIAPAKTGAMFISFITKLRFNGETLSKACFTSREQVVKPSSGPHSLAAAAMSLMAVEIPVALLPSSNRKMSMFSQLLSLVPSSLSSISSKVERHPQYHLAKTLCTQKPLVCPSNLFIFFLGIRTMMFLSQVSISSLFCPRYLISKAFLIFCTALHGMDLSISA